MPPRRRPNLVSAAALPASRLPVGTPHGTTSPKLPPEEPLIAGKTSPPRLGTQCSDSSLEEVGSSDSREDSHSPRDYSNMPPKATSQDAPQKSIAEAKLERQRAKYEEAEAALTAPPPLDRRAQLSRGKASKWKPFDYNADEASSRAQGENGGGVPVEVRINTFRAPSRTGSMARSMSVLSHRTSETGPSDMDRSDSMQPEGGFQLYQGRKNKKYACQLDAYENKPEPRQITVEAAFDKRAVYEVFGNALPDPDFITQNAGYKNGQLQFIQHPNGDVSAQQWSADRYMWENIGQFSNIRKKVEGQLASDRLMGETAYQTLQQNTLAYFRIIAKQREANVTGQPFGAKDIQAAIPEPPTELAAAPTGLKEPAQGETTRPVHFQASQTVMPQRQYEAQRTTSMETTVRASLQSQSEQYSQQLHHANLTPNVGMYGARREDPSYGQTHYQQVYGHHPYQQQQYGQAGHIPQYRWNYPTTQRTQGLNYDFHFPPPAPVAARPNYDAIAQAFPPNLQVVSSQEQSTEHHDYDIQHGEDGQARIHYQPTVTNQAPVTAVNVKAAQPTPEVRAPQPQHVVAFNPRTAARDQLWKLPETAKERSLSQANIRTVLHDPFQIEPTAEQSYQTAVKSEQESTTAFSRNVAGKTLQPPPTMTPSLSRFFPTGLVPPLTKPSSPTGSTTTNILQNSSPDPPPQKQSYVQSTPMITRTSASKATPQTLQAPFFPNELSFNSAASDISDTNQQTSEEKLQEWWTSGNTFARQEEFYQSLKSAQADTSSALSSPSGYPTPIGPPSRTPKTDTSAGAGFDMTRLLIPVLENLSSYVQGPVEKRRDYFSQWSTPAEWMIDNSPTGNHSFYDKDWGTPPARVGRDPRYSGNRQWSGAQHTPRRGRTSGSSGGYGSPAIGVGLDLRFAFAGRY